MSYSDKNKIFFGLLHYIFSEQNNVNWAFKTSLINYTGINESINQRKYKNDSISKDIIKYVKDVKPYHVQIDHYIENYSPKKEEVKTNINDSLFPEINIRYDSVSVKPDIEDFLYTQGTYINGKLSFDDSELEEGTKYFDYNDRTIYKLEKDINDNLIWVYDSLPIENHLYFFKKEDTIKIYETRYIYNYRQYILDMYDLTKKQKQSFENTTMANRLFLYKTHDLDEIKDYLNAHFKGITVKDTSFNIYNFGYNAFLYDLKLYEEPTKTKLFCLSIYDNITYFPIMTGTNVIKLNTDERLGKDDIKIYLVDNEEKEITDYSIKNNIITLFNNIKNNQTIKIIIHNENPIYFVATSFKISNDEDFERVFKNVNEISIEDFKYYDDEGKLKEIQTDCYIFDLPSSYVKENKIKVYIEKPNGYRKIINEFVDYNFKNSNVIIPVDNIKINNDNPNDKNNWKIYITTINDALIYDKIYKWEDIYGIANNKSAWEYYYKNMGLIQNLSDTPFLDPYYNENRPSELTVLYPQNSLFIYISKPNETNEDIFETNRIFNFDFKNNQSYINVKKFTTLAKDFKSNDKEIFVSEDIFDDPIKDDINNKIIPGKIIINSEMIEYNEKIINEEGIILTGLKRGVNGSFLNNGVEKDNGTIESGTIVYPYINIKEENYNLTPSYYYIKNFNQLEFPINGNLQLKKLVEVYKTFNITLLSDIDENSTSFIISNDTIQKPIFNNENKLIKKGYLYIDNDKIEFESINKNEDGTYTISNFYMINNKKYSYGTQIPSKEFRKLSKNEYKIHTEKYDELKDVKNGNNYNYITLNSNPKIGECIIIENHNKNVFN